MKWRFVFTAIVNPVGAYLGLEKRRRSCYEIRLSASTIRTCMRKVFHTKTAITQKPQGSSTMRIPPVAYSTGYLATREMRSRRAKRLATPVQTNYDVRGGRVARARMGRYIGFQHIIPRQQGQVNLVLCIAQTFLRWLVTQIFETNREYITSREIFPVCAAWFQMPTHNCINAGPRRTS